MKTQNDSKNVSTTFNMCLKIHKKNSAKRYKIVVFILYMYNIG